MSQMNLPLSAPRDHTEALKVGRDHIATLAERAGHFHEGKRIRAGLLDKSPAVAEAVEAAAEGHI